MKKLFTITMVCLLSACAGSGGDPALSPATPSNTTVNSSGYISVGNVKVAFVFDLDSDFAELYIPSADAYATVNITTGDYPAGGFYYSGLNCTGNPRTMAFSGAAYKTIQFDGTNYFRVSSARLGSFNYQSFGSPSNCTNSSSSIFQSFSVALTTRPYNFQAIAPLNIQFQ